MSTPGDPDIMITVGGGGGIIRKTIEFAWQLRCTEHSLMCS